MHTLDMIVFSNHVLLIPIVPTMEMNCGKLEYLTTKNQYLWYTLIYDLQSKLELGGSWRCQSLLISTFRDSNIKCFTLGNNLIVH